MAHSYKKHSHCGMKKGKIAKRRANKKVRKFLSTLNRGDYKKIYNSYDICDFQQSFITFDEFLNRPYQKRKTKEEEYNDYLRFFYRK